MAQGAAVDAARSMEQSDALRLIGAAVPAGAATWADLGTGSGTFTLALASLLGPGGIVYAVDRDAAALRQITAAGVERDSRAPIHTVVGDFREPLQLPTLDGVLIANALHYVPYADQARVLRQIAALVTPAGPLVVVEYERRNANPWVPYPIPIATLADVARDAGLGAPTPLATRPSRYSGAIYSAVVRHD